VIDERDAVLTRQTALRRDPVDFIDAAYVAWRVVERDSRRDPGHRNDSCLIFASADAVRRVWHYPADWCDLTDVELEALSWTA
jgi:hypothetical protein